MNQYYQRELDDLRELAAEFARANPALAPRLTGPSPDPDVERVLEGTAFLTGRIRQKIDDDFPEFIQGLTQLIFPHYLRPLPAATIMAFTPKTILKDTLRVPAGTYVDSQPVDGTHCRFRTVYDVDVSPIVLEAADSTDMGGGRHAIDLHLKMQGAKLADWNADRIRFHIGGDFPGAADLYLLLQRHLKRVSVFTQSGLPTMLPANYVRPVGLDPEHAMLPYPGNSFPAFRMLQEYFLLKEKFLFLELMGLSRWRDREGDSFVIRFELDASNVPLPRITAERFALHATPAINLFPHDAEPVLLDNSRGTVRVRPARSRGGDYQVHSIDSVVGHGRGTNAKQEFRSMGMFDPADQTRPVYQASFHRDDERGIAEPLLAINYPPDYGIPRQQTLTIKLSCTNGDLPARLRPRDINRPTRTTSELVEFANLIPPTESQQAPVGKAMLWRLLSHLALNYLSLADGENLKALLALYIFPGRGGRETETANRKRVQGVHDVKVKAADRLINGAVFRGQDITVSVMKDGFAGPGDLYLFGAMLERLLASFSSLNAFTAMTLIETQTGERYRWAPRLGTRPLI
ncbi:MAG TPA: type VI secretion system baseplate subunit TssF [Gammaproteobacteria bacterium]